MAAPWEEYAAVGAPAATASSPAPWEEYAASSSKPPLTGLTMDGLRLLGKNAVNLLSGGVRGAGSIGATIIAPYDMARDALDGKGLSLESNRQRRAGIDGGLHELLGADPSDINYGAGKITTEVAGTAGVGPLLAAPVRAVSAAIPVLSRVATPLANVLESGGFNVGSKLPLWASVPARAAGGAINGGTQAGLINPDDAATGAKIGAALPIGAQAVGKAAQAVGNAYRQMTTPQEVKVAQQLASKLGINAADLTAPLTGPQLIPGYMPTVPQMAQTPETSQLQRTLQTAGHQGIADAERTQQTQMRDALSRIAPIFPTVNDAAARAGGSIAGTVIPAERAATQNVERLFQAVPNDEAMMHLPLQQMLAAQNRFVGPGTFGKGNALVDQAMGTATHIGTDPLSPLESRVVPFSQLQALRSSIGEAIGTATQNGHNQAAAALTAMKNSIDNKMADVAAGNALPGEVFTPQAIDTWGQALAAHQQKMQQFHTGPQASIFRMGADGQPAIQGAEIPGKFYNANRSQVEDMQSLRRLIGNQPALMQDMKSYALTQGVDTAGKTGKLGQSYIDWLKSRSGANPILFSPSELATINKVGEAVQRQIVTEELGRTSGPDTAQKLASLQSNGLLDNKMVDAFARKVPLLGHFTGPMLDGLRMSASKARGGIQAGLLANPQQFADTLGRAPGLLSFDPAPLGLLTRGVYPALSSQ